MARRKKAEWFETFLVVEGAGEFPIDMLRYATCVPATEVDAHKIDRRTGLRRIVLRRFSRDGDLRNAAGFGDGRWRSHGWSVVDHLIERDVAYNLVSDQEPGGAP